MSDEPVPDDAGGLRAANARLRELLAERDVDIAGLEARLDGERELRRRLELRLAETERRLGMDSTDSGTPPSRERIGAKAAAVLLASCGNVPSERAAQVMGMLLGAPVSAGWVDKAAPRVSARLGKRVR